MSGNPVSRKRLFEDDDNPNKHELLLLSSIDNNDYNNSNGIKETNVEFIISNQDNDNSKGYNSSSSSVDNTTIDSSTAAVNNNNNTSIAGHQPSEVSNDSSSSSNESDEAEHEVDIHTDSDMNHDDDDTDNNGDDDYIETRDGDCRVQHAMRNGESVNTILELLELYPMDVQHKNQLGDYPLHTALSCSQEDNSNQYDIVIMKLLELYPVVTQYVNGEGLYPLHLSFIHQISDDIIMKLIDTYPEAVRISVSDWYPLHYACKYNTSQTMLTKLIEMYPYPTQEMSDEGRYPIHYSTCSDKPIAIIKLLLEKDPLGINRKAIGEFNDDYTVFHLATEQDKIEKVKYFIEHCTDLSINVKDISGQTALHIACNDLLDEMVRMLLSHTDININALDDMNETPLHKTLSYAYGDSEIRVKILKRLLDNPCIDINIMNKDNKTPLDIIRNRLQFLQDGFIQNDGNIVMTGSEEIEVRCVKQMIHLLEEFPVKKRWNAFCYHVLQFQGLNES